jgi:hypothetical protein
VSGGTGGDERYYHGTILQLHAGSRTGVLRTSSGRAVPFAGRDLEIVGTSRGFASLRPGLEVGFDLGRNSRGLCVSLIRVYEAP